MSDLQERIEARVMELEPVALEFAKEDQYAETTRKLNKLFEGDKWNQNLHLGDIPNNALMIIMGLVSSYVRTGKWPNKIASKDRDMREEAGYFDMKDDITNRLLDIIRKEFPEKDRDIGGRG